MAGGYYLFANQLLRGSISKYPSWRFTVNSSRMSSTLSYLPLAQEEISIPELDPMAETPLLRRVLDLS